MTLNKKESELHSLENDVLTSLYEEYTEDLCSEYLNDGFSHSLRKTEKKIIFLV
jgi:hypothetical protein